MENNHTGMIMWIVGTGIGVATLFISVLLTVLGKKVDSDMCRRTHETLKEQFDALADSVKDTGKSIAIMLEKIHNLDIAVERVRMMIETQVRTEGARWDRSEIGKKG